MIRVRAELHCFLSLYESNFFHPSQLSVWKDMEVSQLMNSCCCLLSCMFFCSSVWPFRIPHQNKYCVYFPYRLHFYHSIVHSSFFLQTNGKLLRTLEMFLGSRWMYLQVLPLIHISVLWATCYIASEQGKLSAKNTVWGPAHCECPVNHAGLAK